jgi:hypothetical protein
MLRNDVPWLIRPAPNDQPFSRSSETKISLIGTISLFIGCERACDSR